MKRKTKTIFQLTFITVAIILAAVACGKEESGVIPPPLPPSFYNKPDKVVPPVPPVPPVVPVVPVERTVLCC